MNEQRGQPSSWDSADSRQASEALELMQRYAETIDSGSADDGKGHLREAHSQAGRRSSKSTMRFNHLLNFRATKEGTPKPEGALPL
jgi:hypothetical protein